MFKNIIFDLGGIIINLDYEKPKQQFEALGLENPSIFYNKSQQSFLFDEFEKGNINSSEFRNNIKLYFNKFILDEQIDLAWNSILLDIPKARIDLLKALKRNYRTFILSNTNAIHEKAFNEILVKNHGLKNLNPLFEQVYFSHNLGMRKPETAIFDFVLKENQLNPKETIYIEDSIQHIQSAEKLGIFCVHQTTNGNLEKIILDLELKM